MKTYLHEGIKAKMGKNIGAPAQTIVSIFMEIVLNLIATIN